ncbi:MAG: Mur ligase family protein, partial [Acidimicrobiales bacterium]
MTGSGWIASVSPAFSLGVIVASVVGSCLAGLRWLRVAQREHYLAGSTTRFAWRWWTEPGFNRLLVLAGVFGVLVSPALGLGGLAVAGLVAAGPLGLGLRGRTSKLKWTPRLSRVAVVAGALEAGGMVGAYLSGQGRWLAPLLSVAVPVAIDASCRLLAPMEDRLAGRFVAEASAKLARVAPVVVAITGSYGKTSTKGYVAHLVGSTRTVVASPRSFNNRAGLSRAINEGLVLGTDVFVAEMGTYGPGEIAELCEWLPPTVAVITAIGPVHLERFGSEDEILVAKAEITDKAATVVLNVDDERLRSLAAPLEGQGKKVWDVSVLDPKAAVYLKAVGLDRWALFLRGDMVAEVPITAVGPTNVACAVAVALELGVGPHQLSQLLPSLPVAANRLTQSEGTGGFVILDDTYNSNPAGARAALGRQGPCGPPGGRP